MKNAFLIFVYLLCFGLLLSQTSTGTGFFITADGMIVTCAHVIENAKKITVKVGDKDYTAQVLSKNTDNDLAIIKINYRTPYHFNIAEFKNVELGDKVYVLGFPLSELLGSDIRLTDGIISAKSGINTDQRYFQISAPVQPGNSGGPIFNESFSVIGVAAVKLNDISTLIASGSIPQNINFGVKGDLIKSLNSTLQHGTGNIKTMSNAISATVQIVCSEMQVLTSTPVKIINRTGYVVYYLYVSPAQSTSWGSDRLGSIVMQDNTYFNVGSIDFNNRYDIRMVDSDNDTYTKQNVRLSPDQTIEFTISDLDVSIQSSGSSVMILNNTGYTVFYIYLSASNTQDWETDILGEEVLLSGQYANIQLSQALSRVNRYDIKLVDSDGDTYTKWNVLLTQDMQVEFTIADLDF